MPAALTVALAAALGACTDRPRITYPTDDGIGPTTVILVPTNDTTATAGTFVTVQGITTDPDGVDSVYFDAEGTPETFPAFRVPAEERGDTVRWSVPLSTRGLEGDTIALFAQAADRLGNVGASAVRRVAIHP